MIAGRAIRRHASNIAAVVRDKTSRKNVMVEGWVDQVQRRGGLVFAKVSDGTSCHQVQLVAPKSGSEKVQVGCSLRAQGSWQPSQGAQQDMELRVEELQVFSTDKDPRYDSLSPDNLRSKLHLRTRSSHFASLMRLRSAVFQKTHKFFENNNFMHVEPPMLTKNDCEGGGEVFSVVSATGEQPVFLTVSSQLHLEAMCTRLGKVYTLGPAFRAEKQQSHAHMSEFRMLEAEMAFITELDELTAFVESYVREVISFRTELQEEIGNLGDFDSKEIDLCKYSAPWPRIRYSEAIEFIEKNGSKLGPSGSLSKQNELALVDHYGPVFVTHFPIGQKPFYMRRTPCGAYTESFDLLFPLIGELAGGSLRENCPKELGKRGQVAKWYLECRERGQPPTAGFGVGFDRLLQVLFSVRNIKDTIPFPRWYKKCQC